MNAIHSTHHQTSILHTQVKGGTMTTNPDWIDALDEGQSYASTFDTYQQAEDFRDLWREHLRFSPITTTLIDNIPNGHQLHFTPKGTQS